MFLLLSLFLVLVWNFFWTLFLFFLERLKLLIFNAFVVGQAMS